MGIMMKSLIYPVWLNRVSTVVLALFPIALALLLLGQTKPGILALGIAFYGLWVFGEIADSYRKNYDRAQSKGAGQPHSS